MYVDLKTIKYMYGLGHGASSKYYCIYCSQRRHKLAIGTAAQALITFTKKKRTTMWDGGLFSDKISLEPFDAFDRIGQWKPILPIPMERTHMCTLHYFNRIVEKIVHLHF